MYKIIKNIISKSECEEIHKQFEISKKQKDYLVVESDIIYEWDLTDAYSEKFKHLVEDFYSKNLKPLRAYIRKSYRGQILPKHKDGTPFVLSIFLKQKGDGINPLYVYSADSTSKNEIILEEGDGVIFAGYELPHERPSIVSDWIFGMYLGYEQINKTKIF